MTAADQLPKEEHNREDLWSELTGTKSEVSDLRSSVSGLAARIGNVEGSLDRIEQLLSRPKNIPWVGIATLALSIIIGAGTYIQARLAPIEDELAQQQLFDEETLRQMISGAEAKGQAVADRQYNRALISKLHTDLDQAVRDAGGTAIIANKNQARLNEAIYDMNEHHEMADHPFGVLADVKELRGLLGQLAEQVQRIDSEGSRVWKGVEPKR